MLSYSSFKDSLKLSFASIVVLGDSVDEEVKCGGAENLKDSVAKFVAKKPFSF